MHGSQWSGKSAPGVSMTTTNIKWIPRLLLWFSQLYPDWSHLLRFFKGDMSRFDMLHAAARSRSYTCPHTDAHTHTHAHTTNSQSEPKHDRHIFSLTSHNRDRGDVHQRQASKREPWEDLSPSTWYPLMLFDRAKQLVQHSVCPWCIEFKSQWICDSGLTSSMYPLKLSELIKQSLFFQFDLMIKSNQIQSNQIRSSQIPVLKF